MIIGLHSQKPSSTCSVGNLEDLRAGGRWCEPPVRPIFFPGIDDSHCDRFHSSLTAVRCFNNDYVRKQPVAWEEYCAEYWLAWIGALAASI